MYTITYKTGSYDKGKKTYVNVTSGEYIRECDSLEEVKQNVNELLNTEGLLSLQLEVSLPYGQPFYEYEIQTPHGQTRFYHDYELACAAAQECGIPVSKVRQRIVI